MGNKEHLQLINICENGKTYEIAQTKNSVDMLDIISGDQDLM